MAGNLRVGVNTRPLRSISECSPPLGEMSESSRTEGVSTVNGSTTLHVLVTGGSGAQVSLVHNGDPTPPINVTSDPFTWSVPVSAPSSGQDRYRAEVFTNGNVSTATSHIWVAPVVAKKQGCGSDSTDTIGVGALLVRFRKRRS